MPKEKSPGKTTSRRYTDVEKERAVRLCRQLAAELRTNQGVVSRIAKQLDYGPESIRKWWLDDDVDDGLAGPDAQRVRDLEAENNRCSTGPALRDPARFGEHLPRSRRASVDPTIVRVDSKLIAGTGHALSAT